MSDYCAEWFASSKLARIISCNVEESITLVRDEMIWREIAGLARR
jgi:hypothetical protein